MGNTTGMVNLAINEDMVKPILQKQIEAAILANIGDSEELMRALVSSALSQKVNSEGKVDSYSGYNKYDYIEVLTGKAIREAAKQALTDWLKENSALVREMVLEELNDPTRQRALTTAFANAVERSLQLDWNFRCNVVFKEQGDRP